MTPDERIEELLNRAGQTISDLPSPIDYSIEQEELAMEAAADFGGGMEAYILHLTDIIDRMETALENVCGERDHLLREYIGCEDCAAASEYVDFENEICRSCENESKFEWSIPEDWRVDDEAD